MDAACHAGRAYADGAGFSGLKDLVVVIHDLQEDMRQHTTEAVGTRVEIGARQRADAAANAGAVDLNEIRAEGGLGSDLLCRSHWRPKAVERLELGEYRG